MTIHASYGEAFTRFADALPAAERARRQTAFGAFEREGFPGRDIERWHYTDLTRFGAQPVQLAAADAGADLAALALDGCEQRVWRNGRTQQASTAAALAPMAGAHEGLSGLHEAFALPGLQLALGADEALARPLHLISVSSASVAGEMHHLAHRISLARGARAVIILEQIGLPGAARFITQTLGAELGDGAELTLIRLQNESDATTQWLQTRVSVGRDARLKIVNVDFGGALIRNDWNVVLNAPGASAEIYGLFAPDGRTHLDNQYEIEHAAPHGTSRETFRGLGFDKSHSILNGRVVVKPGAMKTDSEQRIANLIFAKGAEIDAKPELEIYADDVKCAHGAACGQLDEQAVFYLRSRGVPQAEARALLTLSFANEVLAQIGHDGLRRRVAAQIAARLGSRIEIEALA